MSSWDEQYTTIDFEQAVELQAVNRRWAKELRRQSNALVNSRLAKSITLDDYVSLRERAQADAAECRRRASLLNARICERGAP
jgi:hypothetical protein